MKQGQLLDGYLVTTKPTNTGGAKCVWAFATKDAEEYFIKEFLEPKWPSDSAPGDAASKRRRRADCEVFETRQQRVMEMLRSDSVGGGNIVTAEAFFRDGARYYKVTRRIDASNLTSLVTLTPHDKKVVLRTLGLSLQQLHRIDIVHGDLKPDNVLVQRRPGNGVYTAKLIDFDDSYVTGQPPAHGTVTGDSLYGAPEWLSYIKEERHADGSGLTPAVDMFALGLMLHEYLTGRLPHFPVGFDSPGAAVRAGESLLADDRLHPKIARLVTALTDARPRRRPDIDAFLATVTEESELELTSPRAGAVAPVPPTRGVGRVSFNFGPGGGGSLRGAGRGEPSAPPPDDGYDSASRPARASRLRIHLDTGTHGPRPGHRDGPSAS